MKIIFKLFFLLSSINLIAQIDTITLIHDHTLLKKKCKGNDCKYWLEKQRVSQAVYEKHLNEPTISICKPCYLKQEDEKNNLIYEGDFYEDCCIGNYIERYQNGEIKLKGQYKVPTKDILGQNIYNMGFCKRDGEWKYYKKNGEIEKIEIYKDGELVK